MISAGRGVGHHAGADTERQRQRRAGRMPRGRPIQDRPTEPARQLRDHFTCCRRTAWFVAARQLAEDERRGAGQDAAEIQLRQHAVETVRPLAHFVEKQHAPGRRVEGERRPERGARAESAFRQSASRRLRRSAATSTCGCAISPSGCGRHKAASERVAVVPATPVARRPSSIGPWNATMRPVRVNQDSSEVLSL